MQDDAHLVGRLDFNRLVVGVGKFNGLRRVASDITAQLGEVEHRSQGGNQVAPVARGPIARSPRFQLRRGNGVRLAEHPATEHLGQVATHGEQVTRALAATRLADQKLRAEFLDRPPLLDWRRRRGCQCHFGSLHEGAQARRVVGRDELGRLGSRSHALAVLRRWGYSRPAMRKASSTVTNCGSGNVCRSAARMAARSNSRRLGVP